MAELSPITATTPPDFLTVEEAAAVLRVGRTKAYEMARAFLASNVDDGLPVVKVGRQLRVPRHSLEDVLGAPITWPIPIVDLADEPVVPPPAPARASRRRSTQSDDGPRLFPV